MVKIPKKVSDRFAKEIGRYQKVLQTAKDRDVNESDTVTIITDMLAGIFGFDKYTEITSELAIRGTYCDLAIKMDGKVKYLIEVKAIGLNLKENYLRQAIGYGANHGIPWVVLTNGIDWNIYKIKFEQPIGYDLVCTFDLSTINPRKQEDQGKIFLLCKEGISKAAIEEFHDHVQSVNRFTIGAIILSKPTLSLIRRELRKISSGIIVSEGEIENIISSEVLKRDIVEGESAEKAINRIKRISKQKTRNITAKIKPEIINEN
jgi:predicted type IV restriction endonuclease